jgi:hypothetical protein
MFTIITKLFRGTKQVLMIKFSLLLISIFVFACNKDTLPEIYSVSIQNNYFEALNSIYFDKQYVDTLKEGKTSQTIRLKKQTYSFTCKTLSSLKLSATINLQGNKENLTIIVNQNGKISIE